MDGDTVPMVVSFNWYRREDYPRILEIMEDRDKLPPDYDTWLKSAEAGIKQMQSKGYVPFKAEILPDDFLAWCRAGNRHVDAAARSDYASALTLAAYKKQGGH